MTVWKRVPDYPFYEVSDDGQVRTTGEPRRRGRGIQHRPQTLMRLSKDRFGYIYVELSNDDGPRKLKVHRLVAVTFVNNPDNKPHVNHIDGDKSNNRANNLEWVTSKENVNHAVKVLGRFQMGEKHHSAILSEDDVRAIRASKMTLSQISEKYGIGISAARSARSGHSWKHIL